MAERRPRSNRWLARHEAPHPELRRPLVLLALAGLPGSVRAGLLWTGDFTPKVQWTLTVIHPAVWIGFAVAVRERVVFPLQTLSNLLAALREGDFSVRGRSPRAGRRAGRSHARGQHAGRHAARAAPGRAWRPPRCCARVMREIDVAIFAFDDEQRLRLVNRAGERLLAAPAERLTGADRRRPAPRAMPGRRARRPPSSATFPGGRGPLGHAPHARCASTACPCNCWSSPI